MNNSNASRPENPDNDTFRHWNRVYLAVLLYAAAIIIGLWLFSRMFEPS